MNTRSPYHWSSKPPQREGYWWYRNGDLEPRIVYVYRDAGGEWSLIYGDLDVDVRDEDDGQRDFLENWKHGQWGGPISEPSETLDPHE